MLELLSSSSTSVNVPVATSKAPRRITDQPLSREPREGFSSRGCVGRGSPAAAAGWAEHTLHSQAVGVDADLQTQSQRKYPRAEARHECEYYARLPRRLPSEMERHEKEWREKDPEHPSGCQKMQRAPVLPQAHEQEEAQNQDP